MPQLDIIAIPSQSLFLIFFILGYVFFVKTIIPALSFRMKTRKAVEMAFTHWLDLHTNKVTTNNKMILEALRMIDAVLMTLIKSTEKKNVTYSHTRGYDMLNLRHNYIKTHENRKF